MKPDSDSICTKLYGFAYDQIVWGMYVCRTSWLEVMAGSRHVQGGVQGYQCAGVVKFRYGVERAHDIMRGNQNLNPAMVRPGMMFILPSC